MHKELETLRDRALVQFGEECGELYSSMCSTPNVERMVDALLDLRGLDSLKRMSIVNLLDDPDASLVLNTSEYLRLPEALSSFVGRTSLCIEDDGYLRLLRVDVEEPEPVKEFRGPGWPHVLYMTIWAETEKDDILNYVLERVQTCHTYLNSPIVTGVRQTWFGCCDRFIQLLRLLASSDDYDELGNPLPDKIDSLMFSDKDKVVVLFDWDEYKQEIKESETVEVCLTKEKKGV